MDVDPEDGRGGEGGGGGGGGGGGVSGAAIAASSTPSTRPEVSMETLFSQFGCMQTLDKKDLMDQVRRLIGDHNITDEAAMFYLEMNQFNVAAAVGAYFDLEGGAEAKAAPPQMTFVRDITIGEGEAVPPNTTFIKTWQVSTKRNGCLLPLCIFLWM
jgi:hypothetical protein